jgi:uncharacterized protein YxjI
MRYVVRQKIFSIGDKFTIKDEYENDIFMVKSQIFSFGKKLRIYDLQENEVCYIEQKLFRLMPEYNIYVAGGFTANVKKKFSLLKNNFDITSNDGQYLVDGDFFAYDFNIYKDGLNVGHVSKKFFSFTDTYGVDIDEGNEQLTILALAIVIDMVCHDHKNN